MSRLRTDTAGSAGVELALIMPFATFMLALALEAGNYQYAEQQVEKGVRDAARYAARQPFSTWNCTAASTGNTLASSTDAWKQTAYVAIYGIVPPQNGQGAYTLPTVKRVWTWDATTSEFSVTYDCVASPSGVGLYSSGFVPVITVIGKPDYPSLLKTFGGFPLTLKLFAREQAAGTGL